MTGSSYYDSTIESPPATMDTYYADASFKIIIDEINKIGKGLSILDVGCGEGLLGSLLLDKNEIYGVDIHKEKVERCRAKGIKAESVALDCRLPYQNEKFDIVTCTQVLEHLLEPDKMVAEIKRVLKPGGKFLATVPNIYDLNTRLGFLFGLRTKISYGSNLGHIRFFSKTTLQELIEEEGFRVYRNTCYAFAQYLTKFFALISYLLAFICSPVNMKELKLRKQKIYHSIDLFLTKVFGFTSIGTAILIFSKKI